ncbi:MAG: DNA polymerase III subunit alpha [Streptosporangiales bacterium]|nr:DNA polymerase III subunit alpha [Streptosporangiales bacterium]
MPAASFPAEARRQDVRHEVPGGQVSGSAGGDSFVHLHVHTEYSMLDGAARLPDLFAEAKRMEMPALAMTDHGNVFGAYEFFHGATQAGVKPIVGIEAYVAPGSRYQKTRVRWAEGGEDDISGGGAYTHMTMLAENLDGLYNLFRLASRASLEGYYYKPRMDKELLAEYGSGIIATTGCPSSEIQTLLRQGNYEGAKRSAGEFREIFGAENFYCELMDHGLPIEQRAQKDLIRLARELDLPFVATNDLHYTHADDAKTHEALLCVQSGKTLADPTRFKFDAQDFYLKSPAEMRNLWREIPEACDNTLVIAERCGGYEPAFSHRDLMPRSPVPEGETEASWLRVQVWEGLGHRFPAGIPSTYEERAEYELGIVNQMGFPGYFLVVADLVNHAMESGIRVGPGRGSAAGAVIAWALGITDLDPIEHGLLFERFLNPERVSMPDIDLDFDERRRGDMIRYATEKYGEDRVSQIVTYGTIKAKQAVKDSSRVLGHPFSMGDRITKAMPPAVMGKDIPLSGIFDAEHPRYAEAQEFRQLYEAEAEVRSVVDTARGLEGLKRQWGVHAAGVILSSERLLDVIPIQRREQDGAIITQFDMGACESLGLLKMDFLGLRNLTVLDDCVRHISGNKDTQFSLDNVPLDDKATFELLARSDTLGVFQLDGGPMRSLLRSMRPTRFEDITAVGALYRPGPMGANAHNDYADRKNGRKPVVPLHAELEEPLAEILGETYGLIVYQEQVMAIAQKVAGYTLGKADLLRRAMGKKKKEILDKEYVGFEAGMKANGYSKDAIDTLWEILLPFAGYAFNKSHAAAYALVSYWTAYLKANYPAEYMSGLLTSVRDDKDKSAVYLHECRRMGVKVLPPDVNESEADFAPRGTDIRFGLAAIRNVGNNVVSEIIAARQSQGRFESFQDFLRKVPAQVCNKRVIESLVKAGAFDSLGHTRRGLHEVHERAVDAVIEVKRNEAIGQDSLFGGGTEDAVDFTLQLNISPEEWDKPGLLAYEREMLGLYVSDHPLFGLEHVLASVADCSMASLVDDSHANGAMVTCAGLVTGLTRRITKQGAPWAVAQLEDLEGSVEVLFFPQTYQQYGTLLAEDAVIAVKGRLDKREDAPRLRAQDVTVPDLGEPQAGPVVLTLPVARCTPPVVDRLKNVLGTHPGVTEVRLHLSGGHGEKVVRLDDRFRVTPSSALMGDLKQLLGAGAVSFG